MSIRVSFIDHSSFTMAEKQPQSLNLSESMKWKVKCLDEGFDEIHDINRIKRKVLIQKQSWIRQRRRLVFREKIIIKGNI